MCGITGYFSDSLFNKDQLNDSLAKIRHRGPDNQSTYIDGDIGLGHARLSIINLDEVANQPMHSDCRRYTIVFNGEIYNYKEIANELNIEAFSDTQVIIEGYKKWGREVLQKLNGMFAFVIFDKYKKSFFGARDRFGIKPFYYFYNGKDFAFASELKSILEYKIDRKVNREALKDYLLLEYIPVGLSIIDGVTKLEKGHCFNLQDSNLEISKYYNVLDKIKPSKLSEKEAIEGFEYHFKQSVKRRQISDVKLGAFLSGGLDSSLVCSHFDQSDLKLETYNIGFDVKAFDESEYAEKVAKEINSNHHFYEVSAKNILETIEDIVDSYDEPFAVPSVIPSLALCSKAKENVTVALGGDGGDELFMGYGYYNWVNRLNKVNKLGTIGRNTIGNLLSISNNRNRRASRVFKINPKSDPLIHLWSQEQYMFSEKEISSLLDTSYINSSLSNSLKDIRSVTDDEMLQISLFDLEHYLPENLLYKMDIASMKSAVEVRLPFLDHELVEYSVNLPTSCKVNDGNQKYLLKKALEKKVSKELVYRKKWGFPAPIENWLYNELSYLIDKYLNKETISNQGYFNYNEVEKLVTKFRKGEGFHFKRIWALIVFGMWHKKYIES